MALKKYTLDTNIILKDPYILDKLDGDIFLPAVVIQELDNKKTDRDLGYKVRLFSRELDKLHYSNYKTDRGYTVYITGANYSDDDLFYLGGKTNDNIIIHIAKISDSILISNDLLVRIKARDIAQLEVLDLTQEADDNTDEDSYKGFIEHYLEDELIDTFYKLKYLDINYIKDINLNPHMFIILKRISGKSGDLIGKINENMTCIEMINPLNNIYGINPKNVEQLMALHLLLDSSIPLVTLIGKAGTGKTLLALASSLALNQDNGEYENGIMLTTPIIDMGKELGTLPGDKEEKLAPYVQSYYDALEFLFGGKEQLKDAVGSEQLQIEIEALNYMRGRSIPDKYFIVDEAQNLTKHEIKTILTRIGEGSKIILMGDPEQIDNPRLDKYNNGLVHVIDAFKDKNLAGHITLTKGVRSDLASMAADIL